VQDNGICPNELNLVDFRYSMFRLGDLHSTGQKKLSKGCAEAAKTAERALCDVKNDTYERDNAKRLSGRDEES
jgi:hypothetical protein